MSDKPEQIIQAGRIIDSHGWCPATSGNFSMREDAERVWVTSSGRHKGRLVRDDIMLIDYEGLAIDPSKKPSAETLLHTQLYRWQDSINAVLHTHSVNTTVFSRKLRGNSFRLFGYEMLKAFDKISTHETEVFIPVFENTQDIASLALDVDSYLRQHPHTPCYLIRGHGMYTWGATMADTLRHVEAIEFLLECEMKSMQLTGKNA